MQFFIALGVLVALASAHLLHQYWSRALVPGDADAGPGVAESLEERETESLKAA